MGTSRNYRCQEESYFQTLARPVGLGLAAAGHRTHRGARARRRGDAERRLPAAEQTTALLPPPRAQTRDLSKRAALSVLYTILLAVLDLRLTLLR